MGQIADDIIDGACCALCGQYFIKEGSPAEYYWEAVSADIFEHGYPVACKECWTPDCGYEKAIAETI